MNEALESLGSAGIRIDLLGEIFLAAALGAVLGIERQLSNKAAGFRTNVLIAVGAALWMQIAELIAGGEHDASRIPSEVVSGIGFIGGGAILVGRGQVVQGLTSAATIWVVAAIGVAVGAHAYSMAVGTTALVLATLFLLGKVEARYLDQSSMSVTVGVSDRAGAAEAIEQRLARRGLDVRQTGWEKSAGRLDVSFQLGGEAKARDDALRELVADPEILKLVRAPAASGGAA